MELGLGGRGSSGPCVPCPLSHEDSHCLCSQPQTAAAASGHGRGHPSLQEELAGQRPGPFLPWGTTALGAGRPPEP